MTLAREARPEDAAALVVPFAVPFAELMGHLAETTALDEGCLSYARVFLRDRFLAEAHRGPEAALAAGRALIAFVARVSRKLHRAADPESVVSICAGMSPILDAKARKRKPMPADHVATRVKAAWEVAIAAGKPEIEAAQACLDAAEAAQAEVLADQERERKRLQAARRRLPGGPRGARVLRTLPYPLHVHIKNTVDMNAADQRGSSVRLLGALAGGSRDGGGDRLVPIPRDLGAPPRYAPSPWRPPPRRRSRPSCASTRRRRRCSPTPSSSSAWATSTRCSTKTRSSRPALLNLTLTSRNKDQPGRHPDGGRAAPRRGRATSRKLLAQGLQGRDLRADGRPVAR